MSSKVTLDDLKNLVIELLVQFFKTYPAIAWIIGILLIVYVGIAIRRLCVDDKVKFLWFVTMERDGNRDREIRERLASVLSQTELFSFVLATVKRSLIRRDSIDHHSQKASNEDGLAYLVDQLSSAFTVFSRDFNKVVLFKPNDNNTALYVECSSGLDPESARAISFLIHPALPCESSFASLAFRTAQTQVCDNVDIDERYHPNSQPLHQYKSIMAIPIFHGNYVVGILTIDSLKENRFDADAQELGELFGRLISQFLPCDQAHRPDALPVDEDIHLSGEEV